MEAVFWTFRDLTQESDNLYLQIQIIEQFKIMQLLTEVDLYLAIEFKVNSLDAGAVNDVAMCKIDIT